MDLSPWAKMKKMPAKLRSITPAPPDDDELPTRNAPKINKDHLMDSIVAIVFVAVGGFGWAFASPFIFKPDYTPVQKYFSAKYKGNSAVGEHIVEMFKAHDAGLLLALELLYNDRPAPVVQEVGSHPDSPAVASNAEDIIDEHG